MFLFHGEQMLLTCFHHVMPFLYLPLRPQPQTALSCYWSTVSGTIEEWFPRRKQRQVPGAFNLTRTPPGRWQSPAQIVGSNVLALLKHQMPSCLQNYMCFAWRSGAFVCEDPRTQRVPHNGTQSLCGYKDAKNNQLGHGMKQQDIQGYPGPTMSMG